MLINSSVCDNILVNKSFLEGKVNTMVKPKSFTDFISEDGSLAEEMTLEEYENKKSAPSNSDAPLKEAYEAYKRVLETLNT